VAPESLLNDCCIEQGMDDDVDTDEEILGNSYNSCVKDMLNALKNF
jgi:hypothetical protein